MMNKGGGEYSSNTDGSYNDLRFHAMILRQDELKHQSARDGL
jgi:hypothetical protein